MTHEYNAEERVLSREVQKLQQERAYHKKMVAQKDQQIVEVKKLLRDRLVSRGVLKNSRRFV